MILTLAQPFTNHNGGNVAFGPDGMLYVGYGDGGSADDPNDNGQNTSNFFGAMLRLDVDDAQSLCDSAGQSLRRQSAVRAGCGTVAVPGDLRLRPAQPVALELRSRAPASCGSATSARTPGRRSIVVTAGGNYGWRIREGMHCNIPSELQHDGTHGSVAEYDHGQGQSVTGGYVYRGHAIPALAGVYLYGDYGSGRIWGLFDDGAGGRETRELADTGLNISSFAQGNDGELYVLDFSAGALYRIVADN